VKTAVTGYEQENRLSIPGDGRIFFIIIYTNTQTRLHGQSAYYSMDTRGSFPKGISTGT
jgi:hypothetical protein